MSNLKKKPVLTRYEGNPIITNADMPIECYTVMNAGATMFNGKVILLLRVEDNTRSTDFYVAESVDGKKFTVSEKPIVYPLSPTEERIGKAHRFDMRITKLDGKYYVFHAAWMGTIGCGVGLATTEDFVNFTPMYNISEPSNRNAVLFPEKINGMYARLDRPQDVDGKGQTWISYSPDLEFWGRSLPLNMPKTPWNVNKCGAGAIPIKTEHGWLEIYHATASTCSSENYYLGSMLLDLDDPSKVVAAPEEFILAAEKDYECVGQTPNVVFTSGAVEMPDGTLNIYYGGADTRMCLAQTTVGELVDFCLGKR
ncbi:MAG: glycoside hydrolase family 130 protein [Defluviitaleaceae bacterium]|nr:glycoside hydrolase family 130 protein [Defluviitaleaceae bacterium]